MVALTRKYVAYFGMYGLADLVGTFNLKGEELVELIIAAVKLGYRSIDTAASYRVF